jgi:hypothetical protein
MSIRWEGADVADRGTQSTSRSSAGDLTAQERVILEHLERQRTGREISESTGIPLEAVRASIRTVLRKVKPT